MEKGSFHIPQSPLSETSSGLTADEVVKNIPLPYEMPRGLDFSEIPIEALKSSIVDSLIRQNEDLMARLGVSLRRSNQLEEKLGLTQKEGSSLKLAFESLRDQYMILQEKERMSTARIAQLQQDCSELKSTGQKFEKLYADIFVQAQSFQRRMVRLERHLVRMRKAARKIMDKARNLKLTETSLNEAREQILQSQSQSMQIINTYEAKLAEVRVEIENLRTKAEDRDQIYDERIRLENTLLTEQRQHQTVRDEMQVRIDHFVAETSSLRLQLKENLITVESQRQELSRMNGEIPNLQEERKALLEQVESLQALWNHKQRELDQMAEKNRSLQKLNQSLSLNLNQQRKDIVALNGEVDKERFMAHEKTKNLIAEVQMLRVQMIDSGKL